MKTNKFYLIFLLLFFIHYISFTQEKSKIIEISGDQISVEILTNGIVNFYKATKTNTYYIENTKLQTSIITLKNLGERHSSNVNRGKMLLILNDCINVRTKTSKSDITESRIIQLINDYNNCSEYTDSFELSEREKIDQSYANQKSIVNFDIGIGYHNQNSELTINSDTEEDQSDGSLSLYASINISPKHLGALTGKLFYDFTFQYNFSTSFEFPTIEQDLSSLFITFMPKYYFKNPESSFNPFIGAGFGVAVINNELIDTTGMLFNTIDNSNTKFIYGFELGSEFLTNFEFTISYYPSYTIQQETIGRSIESKLQNLSFKLGYKF